MADAADDRLAPGLWTVGDVRAVTAVSTVDGRALPHVCALCGASFDAASWIALSVARDRTGGAVVPMCSSCALERWEALRDRMGFVAEMLAAAIARTE